MIYNLYEGKVKLEFDEKKHRYTINGKKVDGTTAILRVISKPALLSWAVKRTIEHLTTYLKPNNLYDEAQLQEVFENAQKAHLKESKEAADIGITVHEWIKEYIKTGFAQLPENEEARNATDKFLQWVQNENVKFLASEQLVYSKQYNYAGTLDFIAKVKGKIAIGDFKTSSVIWDEYWFQVAAYQQAYQEEFSKSRIDKLMIVRLGKDGSLEVKEREDYIKNIRAFNSALDLYRILNELKTERG